ncbi:MAG TPA: DNA polymerase III subunit alpha [Gammaproteobacteria bacterium]|nr:DNA polymerase III subunit alpha [Gammaproteobacteria bacterium]
MSAFVHLRVHTEYSLVDSVVRVDALVDAAAELRMPACAITDQGNVSALVKFYKLAFEKGVKPIMGADVWIAESREDREPVRCTLLCQNKTGFKRLSALLTKSAVLGPVAGRHVLLQEWLEPAALDGLIGLSGAQQGDVGKALSAGRTARAKDLLGRWLTLLPGRFYIELQRVGRPGEHEYIARAVELAAANGVPVVATNDVCFLARADFEAHETRVCIAQGVTLDDPSRPRAYTEEQYLKSPAEMARLFADLPEAVANTVEIARRCSLEVEIGRVFLPDFKVDDGSSPRDHIRARATAGLAARLAALGIAPEAAGPYHERLNREIEVICKMGFEGYFLIVADFIAWARNNSIPVGPGRGSGVGSLVAYSLGITNLDPLAHDLLFERFLNPERVSMPDFDIDFCIDGRDRVIEYVAHRYGRERVAQIVTYGTMAAKAVVRDVGRALGMPYGYVDKVAKLIPFEIGITLDKAIADDEELRKTYEQDEEIRGLIDLARQLEGLSRNIGTHAGGVVIAPQPVTEYMPLYADADGALLTQLDKDDLEAIGLIKFDFLGLKTLTIIDRAVATINRARAERGEPPVDVDAIPVDDPKTYELLRQCRTTAVFQLESLGMRDLIKRLQPDRFDDLTAIVALFRPGPMQMADEFIERKHRRDGKPPDYLHPRLESILKPTYGVILYQEQVMQIAQVLAGYTLGGADLLRRAMGKKKPEEMAKQREVFVKGATERGVEPARASHIFDLMETFAGYGFNKSHAAAYALIAYQTAWLKTHFPEAYMAAVLTADLDNTDRLVVLKDELKRMGITLEPPDVNRSVFAFTVAGPKRISYGLGALKGVGQNAVEAIVGERDAHGPFRSLVDLCRRTDLTKLNRRVLEALVRSGALDALGPNRATLMQAIPNALQLAEKSMHAQAAGQTALFGGGDDDHEADLAHVLTPVREWSKREKLEAERESLGLYLTGHPFDDVAADCEKLTGGSIAKKLGNLPAQSTSWRDRREATIAGVVMDIRRRGNRVSVVLDDDTERIEVTMFEEVFAQAKHLISKHAVLIAQGQLRFDDFINGWRLQAKHIRSVDEAIEEHARWLTILWPQGSGPEFVRELQGVLKPFTRGRCEICIKYRASQAEARLTLGEAWSVRLTRELRDQLTRLLGDGHFRIDYPRHQLNA